MVNRAKHWGGPTVYWCTWVTWLGSDRDRAQIVRSSSDNMEILGKSPQGIWMPRTIASKWSRYHERSKLCYMCDFGSVSGAWSAHARDCSNFRAKARNYIRWRNLRGYQECFGVRIFCKLPGWRIGGLWGSLLRLACLTMCARLAFQAFASTVAAIT